jgi:hypothetical protein
MDSPRSDGRGTGRRRRGVHDRGHRDGRRDHVSRRRPPRRRCWRRRRAGTRRRFGCTLCRSSSSGAWRSSGGHWRRRRSRLPCGRVVVPAAVAVLAPPMQLPRMARRRARRDRPMVERARITELAAPVHRPLEAPRLQKRRVGRRSQTVIVATRVTLLAPSIFGKRVARLPLARTRCRRMLRRMGGGSSTTGRARRRGGPFRVLFNDGCGGGCRSSSSAGSRGSGSIILGALGAHATRIGRAEMHERGVCASTPTPHITTD